jgi:hypothetical protein
MTNKIKQFQDITFTYAAEMKRCFLDSEAFLAAPEDYLKNVRDLDLSVEDHFNSSQETILLDRSVTLIYLLKIHNIFCLYRHDKNEAMHKLLDLTIHTIKVAVIEYVRLRELEEEEIMVNSTKERLRICLVLVRKKIRQLEDKIKEMRKI